MVRRSGRFVHCPETRDADLSRLPPMLQSPWIQEVPSGYEDNYVIIWHEDETKKPPPQLPHGWDELHRRAWGTSRDMAFVEQVRDPLRPPQNPIGLLWMFRSAPLRDYTDEEMADLTYDGGRQAFQSERALKTHFRTQHHQLLGEK